MRNVVEPSRRDMLVSASKWIMGIPYFFDQTLWLLLLSLHVSVRVLFEVGVYFFGKPANIDDSWIRYI